MLHDSSDDSMVLKTTVACHDARCGAVSDSEGSHNGPQWQEAARPEPSSELSLPYFPMVTGPYAPEAIEDILNMLVTMERFVVASVTAALQTGAGSFRLPLHLAGEQASVVSALAHVAFLESLGARCLTNTFTVDGALGILDIDPVQKEVLATIFVGAYLTAAREFAELGQPLLAKYAFQAGAQYAEQRVLARAVQAAGSQKGIPAANKGFETDLFLYVDDAFVALQELGAFGGKPVTLPYPTEETVLTAAGPMATLVIQTTPNNASCSIPFTGPGSVLDPRS